MDNLPICEEAFALQTQMAMGSVGPEMMAAIGAAFAGYFAPVVSWGLPTGEVGQGDYMQMMNVFFPVWMGLVNTEATNVSFKALSGGRVLVQQKYQNHLCDKTGGIIDGTEGPMQVEHLLTYSDGKICGWVQKYDTAVMKKKRELELRASVM